MIEMTDIYISTALGISDERTKELCEKEFDIKREVYKLLLGGVTHEYGISDSLVDISKRDWPIEEKLYVTYTLCLNIERFGQKMSKNDT